MKKCMFFSKDLLNVMMVYVDKDTVKFDIDGHEVELDKWKVELLIQMMVHEDKDTVKFDIDGHVVELDKWKVESLIQMLSDFDNGKVGK